MFLYTWFFPCRCLFCDEVILPYEPCCDKCKKYLKIVPHKQTLPGGQTCLSAFLHEGVHRQAVLNYKFHNHKQYYIQFSIILNKMIKDYYSDVLFDCYTSVPPHSKKNRFVVSFDKTKLLAQETARLNGIEYQSLLYQFKDNKHQHTLSKEERIVNVKDVYRCFNDIDIKGKTILLFDDVVTTGSTLSACADELMKAEAKNVYCITITW